MKDLKILVVDDTVTDRQILSRIIQSFEDAELVGTASNGRIALAKIPMLQPDLVLLDLFMPEMDGQETLARIKAEYPHIDVIMVSGLDRETAEMTVKALESGALDFVPKPRGSSSAQSMEELKRSLGRLLPMARTRKYSRQVQTLSARKNGEPRMIRPRQQPPAPPSPPPPVPKQPLKPRTRVTPKTPGRIDVVVIGVSTGGPNALQEIIPRLPGDFPVPVLTVQHMPVMFTASLAARLNQLSPIRVLEGEEGAPVEKGAMYIAPGGSHLVVRKNRLGQMALGLTYSPPVNSCRPSVDVLFRSVAMVYGGHVLAVILTGMGKDGVAGAGAIRRKGGYIMVQDEKSSVIWGMPGAVVEAGEANEIVPLHRMADRIRQILRGE